MRIGGGYSLVECELKLLKTALETNNYLFLHLLSGQDMPIKTIDDILYFFENHKDYNFIHYDIPEDSIKRCERVKYYYIFQEKKLQYRLTLWAVFERVFVELQKFFHVDRTKNFDGEFKAGSQWWSIKQDLAEFILSNSDFIKNTFKFTMCDEMFVQTIVYNSKYYNTLYMKEYNDDRANQRLIDFNRGHPYVWTLNEKEELINSKMLFARKFDENIDNDVIDEIYNYCKK